MSNSSPDDQGTIDCLACPFCSSDDLTIIEIGCDRGDGWEVLCEGCGASGPFNEDKIAAQEAWNKRPVS